MTDHRAMGEEAIREGFVYVSCGCRGRSSVNEQGILCGKAPVSVADLKAGIRFLRKNKKRIPGNMERIISVGISAGGAMSTLLGCTGDSVIVRLRIWIMRILLMNGCSREKVTIPECHLLVLAKDS